MTCSFFWQYFIFYVFLRCLHIIRTILSGWTKSGGENADRPKIWAMQKSVERQKWSGNQKIRMKCWNPNSAKVRAVKRNFLRLVRIFLVRIQALYAGSNPLSTIHISVRSYFSPPTRFLSTRWLCHRLDCVVGWLLLFLLDFDFYFRFCVEPFLTFDHFCLLTTLT